VDLLVHTRTYTRTDVIECLKLLELQLFNLFFFDDMFVCARLHYIYHLSCHRSMACRGEWRYDEYDRRWSHFLIFVMTRAFIPFFFLNKISKR
jgi:hypothetical protein